MPDTAALRAVLIEAVTAAQNGLPPAPDLAAAIATRGSGLDLAALQFDSLAVMEFCISVELQTGAELTPEILDGLDRLDDVADWIADWQDRRG